VLSARVMRVLDRYIVEVTCLHLEDRQADHLLHREYHATDGANLREALRLLGAAVDLIVYLCDREQEGSTEDLWHACAP
jgi:hypothetical protein